MSKVRRTFAVLALIVSVFSVTGCKPDNDSDVRVTTYTPQDITTTTALCGGDVIVTQGLAINELGICWSTERNPTIEDTCLSTSTWNQTFVRTITGLEPGTVYHVRAFALRGLEYYYGEDMKFTTLGGELPTVTTSVVTNITSSTAMCGGDVTSDGGLLVIERGVCWSTNNNPTITDSHVVMGSGTGSFTTILNGLSANTNYHVRAFAVNSRGIAYGSDEVFLTLNSGGSGDDPTGALNGLFSVSPTQSVYFSQGNLQYQASSNTWRFADNQYDIIGIDNGNISQFYDGWIDLFGWGTSGFVHGAVCYQPWSTNNSNENYYAYGNISYNLNDQNGQADWGYNSISNGGNSINTWRTLTHAEWEFLFNTRITTSGLRYVKAMVNGVSGVVLLPDNWNTNNYSLNQPNVSNCSFDVNTLSIAQWNILEQSGAVFLPSGGYRYGLSLYEINSHGNYWSATPSDGNYVHYVYFLDNIVSTREDVRWAGRCVRLVRDN